MSTFHEQPSSFRIGSTLIDEIDSAGWKQLSIAVAWVRQSGTSLILPSLQKFLASGASVRVIAGIDFGQTTMEGLKDLIQLSRVGPIRVFVFHDENQGVFHPKVYLFSDGIHARLFTGSSNVTQGGLYTNVEALLSASGPLDASPVREAALALESWSDVASPFVKEVDLHCLAELRANGYITDEAGVRSIRRAAAKLFPTKPRTPMFGRSNSVVPTRPRLPSTVRVTSTAISGSSGQVLLVRVNTARGTQVQVPFKLWEDPFFNHAASVTSAHDGSVRRISTASAHGKRNTAKLEMPETKHVVVPVVRFEHAPNGLEYRVFDGTYGFGAIMMSQLQSGLAAVPRLTEQSIADLSRATLWRFI